MVRHKKFNREKVLKTLGAMENIADVAGMDAYVVLIRKDRGIFARAGFNNDDDYTRMIYNLLMFGEKNGFDVQSCLADAVEDYLGIVLESPQKMEDEE